MRKPAGRKCRDPNPAPAQSVPRVRIPCPFIYLYTTTRSPFTVKVPRTYSEGCAVGLTSTDHSPRSALHAACDGPGAETAGWGAMPVLPPRLASGPRGRSLARPPPPTCHEHSGMRGKSKHVMRDARRRTSRGRVMRTREGIMHHLACCGAIVARTESQGKGTPTNSIRGKQAHWATSESHMQSKARPLRLDLTQPAHGGQCTCATSGAGGTCGDGQCSSVRLSTAVQGILAWGRDHDQKTNTTVAASKRAERVGRPKVHPTKHRGTAERERSTAPELH